METVIKEIQWLDLAGELGEIFSKYSAEHDREATFVEKNYELLKKHEVSPNLVSIASTDKVFDVQQNINDIKIVKRLFQLGYSTAKLACNFKKIYSDLLYNFEENF